MAKTRSVGYHGTSERAADSIRKEQHFNESRSDKEWLGWGVYFFAYKAHAEKWIKYRNLTSGCVLKAILEYEAEELLDLDDPDQMEDLNREIQQIGTLLQDHIKVDDSHQKWKKWCFCCNLYRKLHPEIGIISYTFPQRKMAEAAGYHKNERQICVSRYDIIVGIE